MKNITIPISLFFTIVFLFTGNLLFGQNAGSITGSVESQEGELLEAVNVALENTTVGTVTDENGSFKLSNIKPGTYTLLFSSIGYKKSSKKVTVTAGKTVKVNMKLATDVTSLSEIYVKGESFKPENSTITVDVIKLDQIKMLNIEQPLRIIEQVAGVDLVAFRQGGVADQFSIRGFGGGGHAGEAEVQVDGISLNEAEGHSDGYADLNVLIPLNLSRVKVYKGPSSVLYGRFAQGGTLALETRKGGTYQDISISGGSFNTFDAQYAMGGGIKLGDSDKKIHTNLALQIFQTDGYAENAHFLKGNVAGRFAYDISDKTDIALSLRGHSSQWDAPGYISDEQFNDDDRRDQQDVNAENDGGEKQFYSQRLSLNHSFSDNLRLLLFGYAVQQDFTRFAKFGFDPGGQSERFNTRNVYATGGSLNGKSNLGNVGVDWIAGVEYYSEQTERFRWATMDRVRQQQTQDRLFTIQSISAYVQGEFNISPFFRPSVGVRYDTYLGDFEANDPGQVPTVETIDGLSNVAPKLGIRSTIARGLDLRVSVSNGFSLPNSTIKYDTGIDLGPVELWQYELGVNYRQSDWLEFDVAAFILNSSDEIVEIPPGSGDLVNAGSTQRTGVESKVTLTPVEGLSIAGTFSYIETEITDNPEENLEGNGLVGVPQTIGTFNISYATKIGLGGQFRFRDVGRYFISQDNLAEYEGYTVAHLALFYNFNRQSANQGRIFVEVQNLFNSKYAEAVFGSVDSRSLAPAPTRNFTVGVSYSF